MPVLIGLENHRPNGVGRGGRGRRGRVLRHGAIDFLLGVGRARHRHHERGGGGRLVEYAVLVGSVNLKEIGIAELLPKIDNDIALKHYKLITSFWL